ncbi:hypothetical protein ACWD0J_16845 [Streptomyces sp. NPDC003011]
MFITDPAVTLTPISCPQCGKGQMVIVLVLAVGCYAFGCTNAACTHRTCSAGLGPHVLRAGIAHHKPDTPN